MNILIYGEEPFLLENKLNNLKKKYNVSEEDFNYIVYDLEESSLSNIIEDCLTPPFLTETKMVVCKNPNFLTTKKTLEDSKKDLDLLEDYLIHSSKETILVLYLEGKIDEKKKRVKEVAYKMQLVCVENLDDHELFKITHKSFIQRNTEIDDDAFDLLMLRSGHDLQALSNEVEKLSLYSNHITLSDVDLLVARPIEEDVFSITKALLNKDTSKCLSIYNDLIKSEEPVKLIALIASSLRSIYQVKFLDRKGYNDDEIASMLSFKSKYRLKYLRQDGKQYDINDLLYLMNELSHLDINIKTGKVQDRYKALELFLIKAGEPSWR